MEIVARDPHEDEEPSPQLFIGKFLTLFYSIIVTSRPGVHHIPGPLHHRSTILSALGPDYALTVLFLGTHTRTSQWVTHHGIALARYSLNFEVPTEPEASELPKGLALGRDGNIHIRITPLGDVGSHNPPPLGARCPRRHTTARVRLWYQIVTSRPGVHHIPGSLHHRSTILSALGPDYALTVLFLGTHTRTSQWVTHHGIALVRYSLNFEVPTEPEASELPKGLALGRDGNIHIRITPLGDVGSHNYISSSYFYTYFFPFSTLTSIFFFGFFF